MDAAEEVLSIFRAAVDARAIDGSTPEYRRIAEYIAECFWKYSEGTDIDRALRLNASRGRGQPKGTRKVDETSYAALIILLARRFGSAEKAKEKILETEQAPSGQTPISDRKLDEIYASHAPARKLAPDLLAALLSPAHRKLFAKTLRRNNIQARP